MVHIRLPVCNVPELKVEGMDLRLSWIRSFLYFCVCVRSRALCGEIANTTGLL